MRVASRPRLRGRGLRRPDRPALVHQLGVADARGEVTAAGPARLQLIRSGELSRATAQTAGMIRSAAISGELTGAHSLWMGRTELPPSVNSGNHHHGQSETGVYVISGHPVFVFTDPDTGAQATLQTQPDVSVS